MGSDRLHRDARRSWLTDDESTRVLLNIAVQGFTFQKEKTLDRSGEGKNKYCFTFLIQQRCTYGTAANLTISNCFDEGKLHLVGPTLNALHTFRLMHSGLESER